MWGLMEKKSPTPVLLGTPDCGEAGQGKAGGEKLIKVNVTCGAMGWGSLDNTNIVTLSPAFESGHQARDSGAHDQNRDPSGGMQLDNARGRYMFPLR